MNRNVIIKLEDVYKSGYTIPEGYKAEAFRIPKADEYWLGIGVQIAKPGDQAPTAPRIILTKESTSAKISFGLQLNIIDDDCVRVSSQVFPERYANFDYPAFKEFIDFVRINLDWKV